MQIYLADASFYRRFNCVHFSGHHECVLSMRGYWLAREVTGIDSTEDAFFVADSIIYLCVAVWCITTAVGVWSLRGWGRTSILWLSCAVCLIYFPNILWYAYLVKTAPDVGWSWEILYPLAPLVATGTWWLILFTRPKVKSQFLPCGLVRLD